MVVAQKCLVLKGNWGILYNFILTFAILYKRCSKYAFILSDADDNNKILLYLYAMVDFDLELFLRENNNKNKKFEFIIYSFLKQNCGCSLLVNRNLKVKF